MALTALAFIAAYLFGLLNAFISHPRWGLFTYIGVFYLHPPMRWWGASLPEFRWSLVAAIVTLLSVPNAKLDTTTSPWSSHTLTKVIIAYVVWMWCQFPWANPAHQEGLILMTKYVVLFYLLFRLLRTERDLVDFALAHVLGCFYFGALALDATSQGRLENLGGPGVSDSNTLGMHMSTGLMFAGTLILTQKGWRLWLVLAAVPFIANCIMQTQSRGAFLGALMGGVVYWAFAPGRHRKLIVALGAISVFILLAYAPAEYWNRMSSIQTAASDETEMDHSARSRFAIISSQWHMFLDHPLGYGFDTTTYLSPAYLQREWLTQYGGRASHNTVMTILTDQGVPGVIIGTIGFFSVLGLLARLKRTVSPLTQPQLRLMVAAVGASLTISFVAGQFADYLKAEVQLWCLGLLLACSQLVQPQTPRR